MVGPHGCMPLTVSEGVLGDIKRSLPEHLQHVPIEVLTISESRNTKNIRTRIEPFVYRARVASMKTIGDKPHQQRQLSG
jgi:predicted nucleotide-binding protein (sugar kinase/HSP70/actin superfamily)